MPRIPRERKSYVMAYLADDDVIRLKQLALDERTNVADLLREGINLVFKSRKLPPLS